MPRERDQKKAAPKPSANRKKAVSFLRLTSGPSADQTTLYTTPEKEKWDTRLSFPRKKRREITKDPVFPGFLIHSKRTEMRIARMQCLSKIIKALPCTAL